MERNQAHLDHYPVPVGCRDPCGGGSIDLVVRIKHFRATRSEHRSGPPHRYAGNSSIIYPPNSLGNSYTASQTAYLDTIWHSARGSRPHLDTDGFSRAHRFIIADSNTVSICNQYSNTKRYVDPYENQSSQVNQYPDLSGYYHTNKHGSTGTHNYPTTTNRYPDSHHFYDSDSN